MEIITIVQAIYSILMYNNGTMEEAFATFAINFRNGDVCGNFVTWVRGEHTSPYMKADKKGRIFVAQKFMTDITWGISPFGKLFIQPGIIQLNVLKSNSKRGGWLIRTHVQTPILARTKKFQFHNKWVGYWASDAMLEAGLMVKASDHKFGKPIFIKDVLDKDIVMNNINMLKSILGEKIIVPELEMDDISAFFEDADNDIEPY